MGTRSTIKFYDGNFDSPVILTVYQQYDGYWDGVGQDLVMYFSGRTLVNGFNSNTPVNVSNGMGCLAASFVAAHKKGIGNFYIVTSDTLEEYNYKVYTINNKIVVTGDNGTEERVLVGPSTLLKKEPKPVLEFVYDSPASGVKWRKIELTEETETHITGFDINDGREFKQFRRDQIIDGKIIRTNV